MFSNQKIGVAPVNEVIGAVALANADGKNIGEFSESPKNYLDSHFDVRFEEDFELKTVQNTDGEVHLVLPYYESFNRSSAEFLEDHEIEEVTGGEFIISLIIGAAAGFGLGMLGSALAGVGFVGSTTIPIFAVGMAVGAGVGGTVGATALATGVGVTESQKSGK